MPRLAPPLLALFLTAALAACDPSTPDPPARVTIVDLEDGQGRPVEPDDTVRVAYEGRLQSTNELFDTSDRHGGFVDLVLGAGQVIDGLERGLPGMRVGGVRVLIVPPELAYGRRGAGCTADTACVVPPNATLNFRIVLLGINPDDPQLR